MTRYLTIGEVLEIYWQVMEESGGAREILELGALESAIAQPRMTYGGLELYPTIIQKASALGFSLIQDRPFVDGNKRTGHAAVETFLVLNGFQIDATVEEQVKVVLQVAAGQMARENFADWLHRHIKERSHMDISTTQAKGRVPVTILHLSGRIDASNFQDMYDTAKELYAKGVRDLLLDLGDVTFISSAGIVGLHRIALLYRGEKVEEEESGWNAIHAIDRDQAGATQQHVKLLNPTPDVDHTLDLVGFKRYFEIFNDQETAVAAF